MRKVTGRSSILDRLRRHLTTAAAGELYKAMILPRGVCLALMAVGLVLKSVCSVPFRQLGRLPVCSKYRSVTLAKLPIFCFLVIILAN